MSGTRTRVNDQSSEKLTKAVEMEMEERLADFADRLDSIEQRLEELDSEWDIERAIETNAATLALGGTLLGMFVDRRWLWLTVGVTGFLLQHGIQGWCPPVPILRRLGFRTAAEIERERHALKAMRGDYRQVSVISDDPPRSKAREAMKASDPAPPAPRVLH